MKTVLIEPLFISENLRDKLSAKLSQNGHTFVYYEKKPASQAEWIERVGDAEQVILANTPMPLEVVQQAPNLKYINVAFTGFDHVPVEAAKQKGILVSNASGYSDEGVAELAVGMTINLLRRIKPADEATRNGGKAADYIGGEIAGRTVGIIGTGRIGARVAEIFKVMGARLLGHAYEENDALKAIGLEYVSLENLLKASDIVTLHIPLMPSTVGYIGETELAMMKKRAILINCARGPIVDSQALARALQKYQIAGAGLDVFDTEPPLDPETILLQAPNTILTPHVAYFTEEAMEKRARIVFENALDYIEGRPIKTLV